MSGVATFMKSRNGGLLSKSGECRSSDVGCELGMLAAADMLLKKFFGQRGQPAHACKAKLLASSELKPVLSSSISSLSTTAPDDSDYEAEADSECGTPLEPYMPLNTEKPVEPEELTQLELQDGDCPLFKFEPAGDTCDLNTEIFAEEIEELQDADCLDFESEQQPEDTRDLIWTRPGEEMDEDLMDEEMERDLVQWTDEDGNTQSIVVHHREEY